MGAFIDFRSGNGDNFRRMPAPKNAALRGLILLLKLNRKSLERLLASKPPFDGADPQTREREEKLLRTACAKVQALIDQRRSPAWRERHRAREASVAVP